MTRNFVSDADFQVEHIEDGYRLTKYTGVSSWVILPESIEGKPVVSLDGKAFRDAPVSVICIPASIAEIPDGEDMLSCASLESICVSPENPVFFSIDGVLYSKDTLIRFPQAHPAEKHIVKNGTKFIGAHAFSGCRGLKCVILPESLIQISGFPFEGCGADLMLVVPEGSYAHRYAEEKGIIYILK